MRAREDRSLRCCWAPGAIQALFKHRVQVRHREIRVGLEEFVGGIEGPVVVIDYLMMRFTLVVKSPDVVARGQAIAENLDLFSSGEIGPGFLGFVRAGILLGTLFKNLGLPGLDLVLVLLLQGVKERSQLLAEQDVDPLGVGRTDGNVSLINVLAESLGEGWIPGGSVVWEPWTLIEKPG